MILDLILLRHGIAEDVSSDNLDSRKLTEKGKKKLQDNLPVILPFIDSDNHIEVWTSPLTRAKETADILLSMIRSYGAYPLRFCRSWRLSRLLGWPR